MSDLALRPLHSLFAKRVAKGYEYYAMKSLFISDLQTAEEQILIMFSPYYCHESHTLV